jgi:hypothetical protein
MTLGKKFSALSDAINENNSYKLNANGAQMITNYHSLIAELEKVVLPVLKNITKDPNKIAKQSAIQTVSAINSSKEGTELFDIMSRLDTMTNGGKTEISGNSFVFSQNDKILQYLENV